MLWKIYFAVISLFLVLGIAGVATESKSGLPEIITIITGVLEVIGVYNYAFGKRLLTKSFWLVAFWVNVVIVVLAVLYQFTSFEMMSSLFKSSIEISGPMFLFGLLLELPALYALYQLSKQK